MAQLILEQVSSETSELGMHEVNQIGTFKLLYLQLHFYHKRMIYCSFKSVLIAEKILYFLQHSIIEKYLMFINILNALNIFFFRDPILNFRCVNRKKQNV